MALNNNTVVHRHPKGKGREIRPPPRINSMDIEDEWTTFEVPLKMRKVKDEGRKKSQTTKADRSSSDPSALFHCTCTLSTA